MKLTIGKDGIIYLTDEEDTGTIPVDPGPTTLGTVYAMHIYDDTGDGPDLWFTRNETTGEIELVEDD